MSVLVTGAAGFIGYHLSRALLERGEEVIGVDNLNPYYDVSLKEARLALLQDFPAFRFAKLDIAERAAMEALVAQHPKLDRIVNLAAQPGVRHALKDPHAYTRSNVEGQLVLLELARNLTGLRHFVYASSSSVYGANDVLPFSTADRTDHPVSLYAATKKAGELMAHCYSHLFRLPTTGLRFFTVYGPWGRPDMAAYIFVTKILAKEPIPVFNEGRMRRDFTYIDDVLGGVLRVLDAPPDDDGKTSPMRLYNIGNSRAENLMDFIGRIERELGVKAQLDLLPMQPGDVAETYADIGPLARDFDFTPKTSIEEGIPAFIRWYRDYHRV